MSSSHHEQIGNGEVLPIPEGWGEGHDIISNPFESYLEEELGPNDEEDLSASMPIEEERIIPEPVEEGLSAFMPIEEEQIIPEPVGESEPNAAGSDEEKKSRDLFVTKPESKSSSLIDTVKEAKKRIKGVARRVFGKTKESYRENKENALNMLELDDVKQAWGVLFTKGRGKRFLERAAMRREWRMETRESAEKLGALFTEEDTSEGENLRKMFDFAKRVTDAYADYHGGFNDEQKDTLQRIFCMRFAEKRKDVLAKKNEDDPLMYSSRATVEAGSMMRSLVWKGVFSEADLIDEEDPRLVDARENGILEEIKVRDQLMLEGFQELPGKLAAALSNQEKLMGGTRVITEDDIRSLADINFLNEIKSRKSDSYKNLMRDNMYDSSK